MRKIFLALVLCATEALMGFANTAARSVPDSIPACTASYLYDSQNFKILQYDFSPGITHPSDLGFFNWGPSSGNFAIANNPLEDNRPTLFAFDTSNYLVYGGPDTIAGWFPSTRTIVQFGPGYKTVAGYDDLLFLLQAPDLYKYVPGSAPVLLRSDLDPKISQQVVDEDLNFIFVSDPAGGGNWYGDAVVVVDSSGWIRYRFAFDPPLNTYNVMSLFMVNDSLFFISGSLNQAFGRALVHIKLDYDTYMATPVWISSAGDLTHLFSCSPGRLVAGCAPNVEIGPGTTSTGDVASKAFSLYPNPAHDEIYVIGEHMDSSGFEIHGPDGRCVKRGLLDVRPARIDVADLGPGLYVLRIADAGAAKFLKLE